MKKTLIALLTLSGMAMGIEIHGLTFEASLASPMQNTANTNQNFYVDTIYSGNWKAVDVYGGFYVTAKGGICTNNKPNSHMSLTFLYLDPSVVFATGNTATAGQIVWPAGVDSYYGITSTSGAWVDINAAYGSNIHVDAMSGGTVYLNEKGSLTSTLSEGNEVHATMLTTDYEGVAGYMLDEETQTLIRTLMVGDFSSWTSPETGIVLDNIDKLDPSKVSYLADETGLYVKYDMGQKTPEPTTGTLSLLALAGLCIRRRK